MVKNKKKIKKSIKSFEKIIKKHQEKIEKQSYEKPWLRDYWEKQIKEFEHQKEIEEAKLEK